LLSFEEGNHERSLKGNQYLAKREEKKKKKKRKVIGKRR